MSLRYNRGNIRNTETISFKLVERAILLPVYVNNRGPFDFALDTGAEDSVISISLAKELGQREELKAWPRSLLHIQRNVTNSLLNPSPKPPITSTSQQRTNNAKHIHPNVFHQTLAKLANTPTKHPSPTQPFSYTTFFFYHTQTPTH
jgi:hypothetical protein